MTTTAVALPAAAPLRVLVADDSTLMRKLIAAIVHQSPSLELAGEARDGLDALEQAAALTPDVILLDIEMPRMTGLEFLAAARLRTAASVIVISSVVQPGSGPYREALALGAADILPKPSGALSLDLAAKRSRTLLDAIHACRARPQAPVAEAGA
jgi:two-component system chemotaxis response regulator CheB